MAMRTTSVNGGVRMAANHEHGGMRDTLPTRQICTAVYLSEEVRRHVLDRYALFPYWAWAPSYEVDMVAVFRHARRARRLDLARDALLAFIFFVTTISVCYLVARQGSVWPAVAIGISVVAIASPLVDSSKLRSIAQRWAEHNDLGRILLEVFLVLVLVLVVLRSFGWSPNLRTCVAIGVAGAINAWLVVAAYAKFAHDCAREAWQTERALVNLAPPAPKLIEARFADVEDGNLVTYDHELRSSDAMVGAGQEYYEWPITVDTRLGLMQANGKPAAARPIESIRELHDRLRVAVEDTGIEGLICEYRTYADGQGLRRSHCDLIDGQVGPPRTKLPRDDVYKWLEGSDRLVRTQLCLQISSPDGDLVVTSFVRARLVGDYLHVRVRVFVLPPPGVAARALASLPMSPFSRVVSPILISLRTTPGLVLKSPQEVVSALTAPVGRWWLLLRHRRDIRGNLLYDFGAVQSLREQLAVGEQMHLNAWEDTIRNCAVIQVELLRALADFLEEHRIDATGLREDAKAIMGHFRTYVQRVPAASIPFIPKSRGGDFYRANRKASGYTRPSQRPSPEPARAHQNATTGHP
jgi:hypothetical protein